MYVDELLVRDFRAIASSRVRFAHGLGADAAGLAMPNLNLIVGANGSGKSTVLLGIAAVLTAVRDGGLLDDASTWPRIGGAGGMDLELTYSRSDPTGPRTGRAGVSMSTDGMLTIEPRTDDARADVTRRLFAAYGAQRKPGQGRFDADDTRSHLMSDDVVLAPLEDWLPASPNRDRMTSVLNDLLPDDVACAGVPDDHGNLLSQRGVSLPEASLSDGIRSFLAWIGDLLWRIDSRADEDPLDVEGVVLVDEIDQRLHPRWQRTMLTRLGAALPSVQFICTGHTPLLLSGLHRDNLLFAEPDPEYPGTGATIVHRLMIEDVYGYTADQVLASSYFDLASTRSEPFWDELRVMAGRAQDRSGGRVAALEFMRRLAEPSRREEAE